MKNHALPIIVISLLLMGVNLNAQSKKRIKCKYEKNEIDDFTKSRIALTEEKNLYTEIASFGAYTIILTVSGHNENGINTLMFNYQGHDAPSYLVDRFDKIELLLENGEIISLHDGESSNWHKVGIWDDNFKFYQIDSMNWQRLKNVALKKIRIHLRSTQPTLDIPKKYKENIMEAIHCIDVLDIVKPAKRVILQDSISR